MIAFRLFFVILLLLINFVMLDFPAAKILIYFGVFTVVASYLYTKRVEKSFSLERHSDTYKVFPGVSEPNNLMVINKSKKLIHALEIIDTVDPHIATRAQFSFLTSVVPEGEKVFSYPIIGRRRGVYKVGPTVVKFTDLFGIYNFEYEIDTGREIIVFPNMQQMANTPYRSMQPLGVIRNPVPIFEDQTVQTGLREYQFGDETRKINWKVSAKHGKFLVNTYQPSISVSSMVVLNVLESDFDFNNRDQAFEGGIVLAASLMRQLFNLRQEAGFVANSRVDDKDKLIYEPTRKSDSHLTTVLTHLAKMTPAKKLTLEEILDPAKLSLGWGVSLYVLTPRLSEQALNRLIHYRQAGHAVVVINTSQVIKNDLSLWNIGFQTYFPENQEGVVSLLRI